MTLRPEWLATVDRLMADEGFPHVCYVALKGSRLFGIAEEDADVDLRVIYLARTIDTLSIRKPRHTIERTFDETYTYDDCHDPDAPAGEWREKIDFVAYEAERYMHHLLNANGNMIEALLVPDGFYRADEHGLHLRSHATSMLTKQLYNFYRGYARGQFKRASQQINTGKGVTYTFREMYTGIWLMATGEIEFDWPTQRRLTEQLLGWESDVLKRAAKNRVQIGDETLRLMQAEFDYLDRRLNEYFQSSSLPARWGAAEDTLNRMLLRWRSAGWAKSV